MKMMIEKRSENAVFAQKNAKAQLSHSKFLQFPSHLKITFPKNVSKFS